MPCLWRSRAVPTSPYNRGATVVCGTLAGINHCAWRGTFHLLRGDHLEQNLVGPLCSALALSFALTLLRRSMRLPHSYQRHLSRRGQI
jgi:hypothetical protein